VAVRDGKIAYVGRVDGSDAAREVDASGLIVAPGFVDLHTHYDSQVFWDPYCTISGWHGVTSVAIGNCGFGFAPAKPDDQDRLMLMMTRNEAVPLESMKLGMPWDWESYPEFLNSLERTPKGLNMLSYLGLNPLLAYVMGVDEAKSRPATPDEQDEICRLLDEALDAGACGFSLQMTGPTGLQRDYDGTPMISDLMSIGDLLALCRVLRRRREGFIQFSARGHYDLVEQVAETSGRPVIYNTLAAGTDQHGASSSPHLKTIEWLERANQNGLRIFAQAVTTEVSHEFTLEDWNLYDNSPLWMDLTMGSYSEKKAKMADPARRAALRGEYDRGEAPTAGGLLEKDNKQASFRMATIAESIIEIVKDAKYKDLEGMTISAASRKLGVHPIDVMLDIAVQDDLKTVFGTKPAATDWKALGEVANSAYALPGVSDGGAHTKFLTMGSYPTQFLTRAVRERELMSLEDAHWRLSAYPAQAAGFRDRGVLREGSAADIVAYDYELLELQPTEIAHDFPGGAWRRTQKADGYRWVVVNGEVTFEDGHCTNATPGTVLRHGCAV
jgi:N-acyl-D-aspartate/D-glutamate deacylase